MLAQIAPLLEHMIPRRMVDWLQQRRALPLKQHNPVQRWRQLLPKFMTFVGIAVGVTFMLSLMLPAAENSVQEEIGDMSTPATDTLMSPDILETISGDYQAVDAAELLWTQLGECLATEHQLCFEAMVVPDAPLIAELRSAWQSGDLHWLQELAPNQITEIVLLEEYGDLALFRVSEHKKASRLHLVIQRSVSGWLIRSIYRLDAEIRAEVTLFKALLDQAEEAGSIRAINDPVII